MPSKILGFAYKLCRPVIYLFLHRSRRTRVILCYRDEVLLIKSNFGEQKWGLPGGGIKRGETPEQSAVREVHEEVGVELSPKKLRFIAERRSGYGPWGWPYVHLFFYRYRLDRKPTILKLQRFEVSEAQWFTRQQITQLDDLEPDLAMLILG